MKKINTLFFISFLVFIAGFSQGATNQSLSITGVVRQPLNLTKDELDKYQSLNVQLNEVLKDGSYRGAWFYRGVALKTLLEAAHIEKEETEFKKELDIAILVSNKDGEKVALSWGEIFYKNSSDIIIATSASAIRPKKGCELCHKPEVSDKYMKQLDRTPGFPKLVVASDGYSDRSIENVTNIEVIDPSPKMAVNSSAKLNVPSFVVTEDVEKEITVNSLNGYNQRDVRVIHMGDGKGYHGIEDYSGALLSDILNMAGVAPDPSKIFLISAPDGYRATFSYGEIFLKRAEYNIVIADKKNGKPIDKGGKFILVPSDDLMSDRDIMSVEKIEVIDLKTKPKLLFIGTGSGDTNLITMEAVSAIARADVLICPPDIKNRFGKYIGEKPVLFDVYDYSPPVLKNQFPDLSKDAIEKKIDEARLEMAQKIRHELEKGKNVAVIEYGDPTIWSGSEHLRKEFPDDIIEIIPGLSSFNVANALLNKHIGCNGSIVLTTSKGVLDNRPLFEAAAKKGETLSVFMGIRELPELAKFFRDIYKPGTPVNIAYRAGYSGSEKVVKSDVDHFDEVINKEVEKNLFLIYIGPCLIPSDRNR